MDREYFLFKNITSDLLWTKFENGQTFLRMKKAIKDFLSYISEDGSETLWK